MKEIKISPSVIQKDVGIAFWKIKNNGDAMTEIKIKLKRNEPVEKALRRLKRMMDKEGILRELRDRRFFQKPGEKKRKKSSQARLRAKRG